MFTVIHINPAATEHVAEILVEGYQSRELFMDENNQNTIAAILAWDRLDQIVKGEANERA